MKGNTRYASSPVLCTVYLDGNDVGLTKNPMASLDRQMKSTKEQPGYLI